MRLLTAHKILISAFLGLSIIMFVWGMVHGFRGDRNAWGVAALGGLAAPGAALYLRKLRRSPPIK
jgi:hypothetical protein